MSNATGRLNWPFAAAWAACTFIGWLAAVWLTSSAAGIAYYWLAGIFAQIVTWALRWRLILAAPQSPIDFRAAVPNGAEPNWAEPNWGSAKDWLALAAANDHELTWVLAWVSQLHWLGIILLGPGLVAALAFGLAMTTSEIWLLRFAPTTWDAALSAWLPAQLRPGHGHRSPMDSQSAADLFAERADEDQSGFDEANFDEANFDEANFEESEFESAKLSATFHGQSEEGQPYLQGWQRYEMAAGQKSVALTIGFFPPFMTPPDCELDHEGDAAISYEIEHITPAGARVNLKRRAASDAITGKLLWHCCAESLV